MGIELRVWLSREIQLAKTPPLDGWSAQDDGHLVQQSRNYSIFAFPPSRVFPDDVPDEVVDLVPGIAWVVDLGLEGVTPAGEKSLGRIALAIARAGHGVIENPQEGTVRSPSGVKRYVKPPKEDRIDVLVLAWWAPGGPLLARSGIAELIATMQRHLPEAIPTRWGSFEPPNHSLAEEGTDGLIDFLDTNRDDLVVAAPRRPCVGLDFCMLSRWGEHIGWDRFEVPYLKIELEAQLLDQPGWGYQLSVAFGAISRVIRPFYGEARILQNVSLSTGHMEPDSPQHPIYRNWWSGIPHAPPLAAVIGPPYAESWPGFASPDPHGLAFRSSDPWTQNQPQLDWSVPEALTQEFDTYWQLIPADEHRPFNEFSFESHPERATAWPFPASQTFE